MIKKLLITVGSGFVTFVALILFAGYLVEGLIYIGVILAFVVSDIFKIFKFWGHKLILLKDFRSCYKKLCDYFFPSPLK